MGRELSSGEFVALLLLVVLPRVSWLRPSIIPNAVFSLCCRVSIFFCEMEEVPIPKRGELVSAFEETDSDGSWSVSGGASETESWSDIVLFSGAGGVTVMYGASSRRIPDVTTDWFVGPCVKTAG